MRRCGFGFGGIIVDVGGRWGMGMGGWEFECRFRAEDINRLNEKLEVWLDPMCDAAGGCLAGIQTLYDYIH